MPLDLQPASPLHHTPSSSPSAHYPHSHQPHLLPQQQQQQQASFNPFLSSATPPANDPYPPPSHQQPSAGPSTTAPGCSTPGGSSNQQQQQQQQQQPAPLPAAAPSAVASPITGTGGQQQQQHTPSTTSTTSNTTPSHVQAIDLLGGLGLPPLMAGASPTSSLAPSRQPSSSGGAASGPAGGGLSGGGGGTFTPDLSARINAMSLESKIRDIEGIISTANAIAQQGAIIRDAILAGQERSLTHGDLADISQTLKAIAAMDPPTTASGAAHPLSLLPMSQRDLSSLDAPIRAGMMMHGMGGNGGGGPGGLQASPMNQVHYPPSSSGTPGAHDPSPLVIPNLSIDVSKALAGVPLASSSVKRPAPLSSPAAQVDEPNKHLRMEDQQQQQPASQQQQSLQPSPTSLAPAFLLPVAASNAGGSSNGNTPHPQPPQLIHAHSYPSLPHLQQQQQQQQQQQGMAGHAMTQPPTPEVPTTQQQTTTMSGRPVAPLRRLTVSSDQAPSLPLPPPQQQQMFALEPALVPVSGGVAGSANGMLGGHPHMMHHQHSLMPHLQAQQQQAPPPQLQHHPHSMPMLSTAQQPQTQPQLSYPPPTTHGLLPQQQQPLLASRRFSLSPDGAVNGLGSNGLLSEDEGSDDEADSGSGFDPRRLSLGGHSNGAGSGGGGQAHGGMSEMDESWPGQGDVDDGGGIGEELNGTLDGIFLDFLGRVCSDINITDSKGEQLHQTLMPKKMQRLDESWDFRPFKFRIQAFTNAFTERIQADGISDELMPAKKIKLYLWNQPYVARFNDDGKKAKSKGNHIWNVDARKLPGGGWEFRRFQRKIAGAFPGMAFVGVNWSWQPRVWDPHTSSASIDATFASPPGALPPWLSWSADGATLSGTPPPDARPCAVEVVAAYTQDGAVKHLREAFHLHVASVGTALAGSSEGLMSGATASTSTSSAVGTANTTPVPAAAQVLYGLSPQDQQQATTGVVVPANGQQQQPGISGYYPVMPAAAFVNGQMMSYGDGLMQPGMVSTFYNGGAPTASMPLMVGQAPQYLQQQQQQPTQTDHRLLAAEVAVVQAVEEKHYGQGQSYPPHTADPSLVAESDALSNTVLAQAHAQRQEQFGQTGFVSSEFAQSTLDDATNRARDAVHRSAELLPPSATSADLIRASSSFLPAPMPQQQVQQHAQQQQQQQQQAGILPPGSGQASQFNSPYVQ